MKRNVLLSLVLFISTIFTAPVFAQYRCIEGQYSGLYARNFVSNGEVVESQQGSDPYCWVTDLETNERFQIKASEVQGFLAYEGFVAQSVFVTQSITVQYEAQGNPYSSLYADVEGFNVWWLMSEEVNLDGSRQFNGINETDSTFWTWDISRDEEWSFRLYVQDDEGTVWGVERNGDIQVVVTQCIQYTFEGNQFFDGFTTTGEGQFDSVGNIRCVTENDETVPFTSVALWHDYTLMEVGFDFDSPVSTVYEMRVQRGQCPKQQTTCVRQIDLDVHIRQPITLHPTKSTVVPTWQAYMGEIITATALPVLETEEGVFLTMAPTGIVGRELKPVVAVLVVELVASVE